MTETGQSHARKPEDPRRRRRRCWAFLAALGLLLLTLLVVGLVLAFTVFRRRDPQTTVISANLDGVSPRVTFPNLNIDLNVSLRLQIRVHNPNYAGFRHNAGKSYLYYRDNVVGDADIDPGRIPARGSETIGVQLTINADRFTGHLTELIQDALSGRVGIDWATTIPGRVSILRFIRRHAVATSRCHVVFGFPDLRIRSQECQHKTKL